MKNNRYNLDFKYRCSLGEPLVPRVAMFRSSLFARSLGLSISHALHRNFFTALSQRNDQFTKQYKCLLL